MKKKVYFDFDDTLVRTNRRITELYNNDYKAYPNFKPIFEHNINTWGYKEMDCAKDGAVLDYFNQPRFFDGLTFNYMALEVISKLIDMDYEVTIVTLGDKPNLALKGEFLQKWLPYSHLVKFIGLDLDKHQDKSSVDMSDGILVDDHATYLANTNAYGKISFGVRKPWNVNWDGIICYDMAEVLDTILNWERKDI